MVGCWLAKSPGCAPTNGNVLIGNNIILEKDSIVLLNVNTECGASAANVSLQYCALNIYKKYFNK